MNSSRLPARRQADLQSYLNAQGHATIADLALALQASESTVRRDLDQLAKQGKLRRTHGGATVTIHPTTEIGFADRRNHQAASKAAIGRQALSLLEPGQCVIFDSSTTVLAAVEALAAAPIPLTAVTHDLHIATLLALIPEIQTVVPGGEVRPGSFTLLGATTTSFFERLHVDVAFIGIHAITDHRLSEGGLAVAEMKGRLMQVTDRCVLLADHSKFGPPAFYTAGSLHDVHDLVTDRRVPPSALASISTDTAVRVHLTQEG